MSGTLEKMLADLFGVEWAKAAWTFFSPFTDLFKSVTKKTQNKTKKSVTNDYYNRGYRNTRMFKAEKDKVFALKESWKVRDKIST